MIEGKREHEISGYKQGVRTEILASYDKLYLYIFVKNEQDAMDVVQESVYKAMKNASQIQGKNISKHGFVAYCD